MQFVYELKKIAEFYDVRGPHWTLSGAVCLRPLLYMYIQSVSVNLLNVKYKHMKLETPR